MTSSNDNRVMITNPDGSERPVVWRDVLIGGAAYWFLLVAVTVFWLWGLFR